MVNKNALSPEEIDQWFVNVPPVPANTFEFALVMGGTVSAGAYTAGVVDFLIEALDSWTALRAQGDAAAPKHNTVLRVITGTSGGGVNAAITARALAYEFPHVTRATANWQSGTGNPFFDIWVNTLTLNDFLAESIFAGQRVLRIVHGKGLRSGHRGPVLKQLVNATLQRIGAVLAFASAREVDGGTGASLVLLSAPRRSR